MQSAKCRVKENRESLLDSIAANGKVIFPENDIVKESEITVDEEGFAEFYCGGAGMGSATFYRGFYYTPTDDLNDLVKLWCAQATVGTDGGVTPDGEGYIYRQTDGDNYFYVEKICDNFYYYEAGF